jgi:hypothetical protein
MLTNIIILAISEHGALRPNKLDRILEKAETRGPVPKIPGGTHHAHLDFGIIQPRSKGRFTLWTMKSSHGRLSDVNGR